MKIVINEKEKADLFVNLFLNLKLITENVNFEFNSEGLNIQGMDSSQICIYDLFIEKNWFSDYHHEINEVIGVNMLILSKILNVRSDHQKITIYNENDKLSIDYTSNYEEEINKQFEISLLEIDQDKMSIPETEYDVNILFNSKIFKSIINELKEFGDVLNIYFKDSLYFKCSSLESSMNVELKESNVEELTMTEDSESIDISFSIKYIYIFSQFYKITSNTEIGISENIPLKLQYKIGDNSYCNFYLAPKIND